MVFIRQLVSIIDSQMDKIKYLLVRLLLFLITKIGNNMNRPKNISVGVYDAGNGELRVWCCSFSIKGSLIRKDGIVDNEDRNKKEQLIARTIEKVVF